MGREDHREGEDGQGGSRCAGNRCGARALGRGRGGGGGSYVVARDRAPCAAEVAILERVDHPNIVQLREVRTARGARVPR